VQRALLLGALTLGAALAVAALVTNRVGSGRTSS
jgi:hypothetical protein